MWNLFKSDVYRLFHSRYFQVLVLLYFVSVALMVSAGMVEANNGLVSFDYKTTPFSEYLCFLPLNVLFGFFVFLSYVMLLSDEYQKGYVKNLYPYFQKKVEDLDSQNNDIYYDLVSISSHRHRLWFLLDWLYRRKMGFYRWIWLCDVCIGSTSGCFFDCSCDLTGDSSGTRKGHSYYLFTSV